MGSGYGWQPCRGRPEVCRRPGCSAPAVVEMLGLCEAHLLEYRAEQAGVLALAKPKAKAATPR